MNNDLIVKTINELTQNGITDPNTIGKVVALAVQVQDVANQVRGNNSIDEPLQKWWETNGQSSINLEPWKD